ncbi:uncharacterized protein LOC136037393 isoform X1 [Artemia franciscana]|uniref:N-acetyltransferase domain-containing protein n=1 Tax=Artemia franciscana TaxID=6661 RepID=A0AA88I339_ARTSF|nr:hypothetical protein QYM36_004888 [Artemia franciscana]
MTQEYRKEKNGIIYEIAKPEHYEDMKRLFLHDFMDREPLSMAAGHNNEFKTDEEKDFIFGSFTSLAVFHQFTSFRSEIMRKWLTPLHESQLSILAKDAATNEIIGLRTCKILRKGCKKESNIEGSISSYLEDLKNFDLFEKYGVEEIIEFTFLVVKHTHTRQGIAKELVLKAMELAKERGFCAVTVIATNPITISMFEKLNFDILKELSISDYTIDGVKAFPNAVEGHIGKLYGKKLL